MCTGCNGATINNYQQQQRNYQQRNLTMYVAKKQPVPVHNQITPEQDVVNNTTEDIIRSRINAEAQKKAKIRWRR